MATELNFKSFETNLVRTFFPMMISSDDPQQLNQTYVDLVFEVTGQEISCDYGYQLYAALSSYKPLLHCLEGISIQLINGSPIQKNILRLTKQSRLRLRLPAYQISNFYSLAGKALSIGEQRIRLGIPQIRLLEPVRNLYSPIAIIRGYEEPRSFLEAAHRQLQKLGVKAEARLLRNHNGEPSRRIMRIKQFKLVGFGLEITDLCEQDSLILQIHGIGGKQKMGCGSFIPHSNASGSREGRQFYEH